MPDSYQEYLQRNVEPSTVGDQAAIDRFSTVLSSMCAGNTPPSMSSLCLSAKDVLQDRTGTKTMNTSDMKRLLDTVLRPTDPLPCVSVTGDGQRLSWFRYDPLQKAWASTLSYLTQPRGSEVSAVIPLARVVGFLTHTNTTESHALLESYLKDLTKRLLRTIQQNRDRPEYDPARWIQKDSESDDTRLGLPLNIYTA